MRIHRSNSEGAEGIYFIARLGFFKMGPFSHEEVKTLLLTGRLRPNSKIWRKDLNEWTTISSIPDFHDVLSDLPPSPISGAVANLKTYFNGMTGYIYITGFLALIAVVPVDIAWHPDWYNDTVYIFKNPKSEGFWPHEVQYETPRKAKGYSTTHYTFNGILAGWNWCEFILYVGSLWALYLLREFQTRRAIKNYAKAFKRDWEKQ